MSESTDFFVVGGTLRAQSPSYVTRPADQELFDHALAGEFCYVLTSRQMGKSSLMVRTARRLEANGLQTVIIDLTSIGTVSVDEWYFGLLSRIRTSLRLPVDAAAWWAERQRLSPSQRFMEFLRDVVLTHVSAPIVIFVDEIDTTLNLAFRDDFFAAIRALYNERAATPEYQRLTFVLLGVATPTDLIQDRDRTPFNIGRQIMLQEFSYEDAAPLRYGLDARHAQQDDAILLQIMPQGSSYQDTALLRNGSDARHTQSGDAILREIFAWTNGHPYLTQKLCQLAATAEIAAGDAPAVEALVQEHFLAKDAPDDNLKFVQSRIQSSPPRERRRMLRLYRRIHAGETVPDDDRSKAQNYLELYGLVRPEGQRLRVRNKIYQRVFDQRWVKASMPPIASPRLALALSLTALLVVVIAVATYLNRQTDPEITVGTYVERFHKNTNPEVRLGTLAALFRLQQDWRKAAAATTQAGGKSDPAATNDLAGQAARELFLSLEPGERRNLFLHPGQLTLDDVKIVAEGLHSALNIVSHTAQDADPDDQDPNIMEAIVSALRNKQIGDSPIVDEIENWATGRREAAAHNYQEAIQNYTQALHADATPQSANPAIYYDRALAQAQLKHYPEALADLDNVVKLAQDDLIGAPDDAGLASLIQQTPVPSRFVSANRTRDIVKNQLQTNPALLAALQSDRDKFPKLASMCDRLLADLASTQTAQAQAGATATAQAAQATVAAVGAATATVLGQTAIAQAATATGVAGATQTSLAVTSTSTPTRTPLPTPVPASPTASVDVAATDAAIQAATSQAVRTVQAALDQATATAAAQAALNATSQAATAAAQAALDATSQAAATQTAIAQATAQAAATQTAIAQAIQNATATAQAPPTQVIVFSGVNFTGNSQSLASGDYGATVDGVPLGNDTIKSLRIPQGWSVVLYRDYFFQLPSPILTQDVADESGITAGVSGVCVRAPGENPQTCPNMQPPATNTPTVAPTVPSVASAPANSGLAIPGGLKVTCLQGPDTLNSSSTCPVLNFGGRTYWAYSYIDNRVSMSIVAYDAAGNIVQQWNLDGARYVWQITVDSNAKTVTFWGQANGTVTMSWAQL